MGSNKIKCVAATYSTRNKLIENISNGIVFIGLANVCMRSEAGRWDFYSYVCSVGTRWPAGRYGVGIGIGIGIGDIYGCIYSVLSPSPSPKNYFYELYQFELLRAAGSVRLPAVVLHADHACPFTRDDASPASNRC